MKFTIAAFAALLTSTAAEVYFKEQFNDDVSACSSVGVFVVFEISTWNVNSYL